MQGKGSRSTAACRQRVFTDYRLCMSTQSACPAITSSQESLIAAAMRLQLLLQGNGMADGYGDFVGTGTLHSYDGYFQGSGTFMGAGDCEGTHVYSS